MRVGLKYVLPRDALGEGDLRNLLHNDASTLAGTTWFCTLLITADVSSNSQTLSLSALSSESISIF